MDTPNIIVAFIAIWVLTYTVCSTVGREPSPEVCNDGSSYCNPNGTPAYPR